MSWAAALIAGAAALGGAGISASGASADRSLQKRSMQEGIRWRVADAHAAGVHPLYALGAPTFSPSPSGDGGAGALLAQGGQDISRAMLANRDARAQRDAVAAANMRNAPLHSLALERASLENELLRSQIARMNSAQLPVPGAPVGAVEHVPSRVIVGSPGEPARQPGSITDYQYARLADGGYLPVMSEQMKERTEDSPMQWEWYIRNNILPRFGGRAPAPPFRAPVGHRWRLSGLTGAWYLERGGGGRRLERRVGEGYFGP